MLKSYHRNLGSTSLKVSPIGLGTVKFGRNQQVKYPEPFELPSDQDIANLLSLALDLGINLIDTAPAYGSSEIRLGKHIKNQRSRWIIMTKAGETFDNGCSHFDFTPEHIQASVRKSLTALKTDYLDIVMIHSNGDDEKIISNYGTLEVLDDLKSQGLIRASGMSTKTVSGGILALLNSDCVMSTYNLNHQQELAVLDYAKELKKGVLIKKAFASGHNLTNGKNEKKDVVLKNLKFVFAHSAVTAAIIGTINPNHLQHNAKACYQALSAITNDLK